MPHSAAYTGSKAPMLYVLVAFIAGIICYDRWGIYISRSASLYSWIFLLLITISLFSISNLYRRLSLSATVVALVFATLTAWTLYAFQDQRQASNWIGTQSKTFEQLRVQVIEAPQEKQATYYLPVRLLAGRDAQGWHEISGQARLYVYKHDTASYQSIDAIYEVPGALQLLRNNHNPFATDFVRQQQRNGFYHQLFVSPGEMHLIRPAATPGWAQKTSNTMASALQLYIPDTLTSALAQATLLNQVPDEINTLKELYTHTGIMHIIAISGMHVNLLFLLLVLPFYRLRDPGKQWIKYLLVLPFVWAYIALCGYPPSAIRAALSFSLITLALCTQRRTEPIQLWATTALALLCIHPAWLYHIGVQLSLLAVLSIILFYRPIRKWFTFSFAPLQWLWDCTALSLSVQILVAPLIIYYFHQFPVWFLPANVFAALFSTVLMVLSLLVIAFAALYLPSVAMLAGKVLVACTGIFHKLLAFFERYTPDAAAWLPLDAWDYVLLMLTIVVLAFYFLRKYYPALPAGIALLLFFVINLMMQDFMAARQQGIVVYAAGKQSLVSCISGRKALTYSAQPLSTAQENYTLKPAYLGYRIRQQQVTAFSSGTVLLSGKKIVWAAGEQLNRLSKGMDVLILSGSADPGQIDQLHPAQVVLAGGDTRSHTAQLQQALQRMNYAVYNVEVQGAWIFFE